MFKKYDRRAARNRRHLRVRKRITGTAQRPRLTVHRSLNHITAQLIDDDRGHTVVSASSVDSSLRAELGKKNGVDVAAVVGREVAERAKGAGVEAVVFDRGGYLYHGRVKALADAARLAGLRF